MVSIHSIILIIDFLILIDESDYNRKSMNRRSSTAYAESNGPFTLKASFSHDSAPT